MSPTSDEVMPAESDRGNGLRSVRKPIAGCSSDAVTWKVKVSMPICQKSSR
jgi:hypothetical protein